MPVSPLFSFFHGAGETSTSPCVGSRHIGKISRVDACAPRSRPSRSVGERCDSGGGIRNQVARRGNF